MSSKDSAIKTRLSSRVRVTTGASSKPTSRAASKPAAGKKSGTTSGTKSGTKSGASRAGSKAAPARDPNERGMQEPWFSMVAAGLKTKDIRPVAGPPKVGAKHAPLKPFEDFKPGDKFVWINSSLKLKETRKIPVKVVSVTPCNSSEIEGMLKTKGASAKFTPTLTPAESVEAVKKLLRLDGGEDRKFVCIEFVLAV